MYSTAGHGMGAEAEETVGVKACSSSRGCKLHPIIVMSAK